MSDRLTDAELDELESRAQEVSMLYPFTCRFDVARRLLAEVRKIKALEALAKAARRYHGRKGPNIDCAICRALDRLDKASGVKP